MGRIKNIQKRSTNRDRNPNPNHKGTNQMCGLPVEIWTIILEMVVEFDLACYDTSLPIGFPLTLRPWDHLTIRSNVRWKNLRLVCRDWSVILSLRWTPFLKAVGFDDLVSGVRTRGLYVTGLPRVAMWSNRTLQQYPLNRSLFLAGKSITTIVVGTSEIRPRPHPKPNWAFIWFLFKYSEYFSSVRSFTIFIDYDPPSHFWGPLEMAFPKLVVLQIRGRGKIGHPVQRLTALATLKAPENPTLTLLDLETVEMLIEKPPICHFPALKHVTITAWLKNNIPRLIPDNKHNIESILIWDDHALLRPFLKKLWKSFPALRFLGVEKSTLLMLPSPPNDHPIRYIWLLYRPTPDLQLDIPSLRARIPQLRYLSIEPGDSSVPNIQELQERCAEHGITYINVVDRKPKRPPPPNSGPSLQIIYLVGPLIILIILLVFGLIFEVAFNTVVDLFISLFFLLLRLIVYIFSGIELLPGLH